MLGANNNLADLLALFFRDDITAWSQRRQQRGGGWRTPQLKQLVDHNIDQCLKRMGHVAPSRPQEVQPECLSPPPLLSPSTHMQHREGCPLLSAAHPPDWSVHRQTIRWT